MLRRGLRAPSCSQNDVMMRIEEAIMTRRTGRDDSRVGETKSAARDTGSAEQFFGHIPRAISKMSPSVIYHDNAVLQNRSAIGVKRNTRATYRVSFIYYILMLLHMAAHA